MIKDRILQFIDYKQITKNKFETECGLPVRYVSNIGKSIQYDVIEKIVLTFPDINLRWLVTGLGEMVMEGLKELDKVSYVRFASVYRQFTDLENFIEELNKLLNNR